MNSTLAIQSFIHLHFDCSNQVPMFEQRNQRSSLGPHGSKHVVLKLETSFVATNFLIIFEEALLDKVNQQFLFFLLYQSEDLGHEHISILDITPFGPMHSLSL